MLREDAWVLTTEVAQVPNSTKEEVICPGIQVVRKLGEKGEQVTDWVGDLSAWTAATM